MNLPPGLAVLVACVREDPPDLLAEALGRALAAGEDLVTIAGREDLASLLQVRLQECGLEEVLPEPQRKQLFHAHLHTARRQTVMLAVAAELARRFRDAGVRYHFPIKGVALAALRWPDYLPRGMVDLDWVVSPEEFPVAWQVLEDAGFQCEIPGWYPRIWDFQAPGLGRRGVGVELHWDLWAPTDVLNSRPPTVPAAWERAIQGRLHDEPLRVPGFADGVLIAATTLARDRFAMFLRQWADLWWAIRWARDRDWGLLMELAESTRVQRLLSLVLAFAGDLFGDLGIDPDVAQRLGAAGPNDARLRQVLWRRLVTPRVPLHHPLLVPGAVQYIRDLLGGERLQRLRYLRSRLRPGRKASRIAAGVWTQGGWPARIAWSLKDAWELLTSREHRRALFEERLLSHRLRPPP